MKQRKLNLMLDRCYEHTQQYGFGSRANNGIAQVWLSSVMTFETTVIAVSNVII